MVVNYGSDRVRFLAPVPTGSRLRAGVEFTCLGQTPSGHQLRATVIVETEGAEKPARIAEIIALVVPQEAGVDRPGRGGCAWCVGRGVLTKS